METLIALRGPDLLRIKGLLNLAGSKGPVVFQAVQHLIHPPVELAAWPDKDHASRVVFITRGVSERQVRDLFKACRALGYFERRVIRTLRPRESDHSGELSPGSSGMLSKNNSFQSFGAADDRTDAVHELRHLHARSAAWCRTRSPAASSSRPARRT